MIIGHRNYRSYDEVIIMIIKIFFENMVIVAFLAC